MLPIPQDLGSQNSGEPKQELYSVNQEITDKDNYEFAKYRLETAGRVRDLEHYLRGDTLDIDKNIWVHQEGATAILNEEGRRAILTFLIEVDKSVILSAIDEDRAILMARESSKTIINLLADNCFRWEIHLSYLTLIVDKCRNLLIFITWRAVGGGERTTLKGHTITERLQSIPQAVKKSFWGRGN